MVEALTTPEISAEKTTPIPTPAPTKKVIGSPQQHYILRIEVNPFVRRKTLIAQRLRDTGTVISTEDCTLV